VGLDPGESVTCTFTNTYSSADFVVSKDFVPDSGASVSVSLSCTSGTVVTTPLQASEGAPAVFTVKRYAGNPTCTASENPIPAGYDSTGACGASLVSGGQCTITNTLRSHQFTVKKDFIPNSGASVNVSLGCTSGQVSPASASASEASPAVFTVTGYVGDPACTATESPIPAGYDSSETCGASLVSGGQCTITNTLRSHQFTVKKDFVPDSEASVSVSLGCTSGQVSPASASASEGSPAVFTVTGYVGNPTCTATESPIPTGYDSSGTCAASLVSGGECTITNTSLRKPVDVMLVIDRSGSMGDPPVPIANVKAAAKAFVDKLDPLVDQVGLVSYADSATLDHQLAGGVSGFAEVKGAIDDLSAGGYTNIGDGVYTAQQELQSVRHNPDAIPVIVLLTDGIANRQNKPPPEHRCTEWPSFETGCTQFARSEAAAAKGQGTIIFTVGLSLAWDDQPPAVGALARQVLRDMATQPWSAYYFETGVPGDLVAIFEQIAGIITDTVTSAGTASAGSDGSDPLAAALALVATAPIVAVISISRLRRRR
jgi:hypothetical protein